MQTHDTQASARERGRLSPSAGSSEVDAAMAHASREGQAAELSGGRAQSPLLSGALQTIEIGRAYLEAKGGADDQAGYATRGGLASAVLRKMGAWSTFDDHLPGRDERLGDRAVEKNILDAASDTKSLALDREVNRAEAVTIVSRAFDLPEMDASSIRQTFPDLPVTHWAAPRVYGAVARGVVRGIDGHFRPADGLLVEHLHAFIDKAADPPGPSEAVMDPTKEGMGRTRMPDLSASLSGTNRAHTFDRAALIGNGAIQDRVEAGDTAGRVSAANSVVDHLDAGVNNRYQPTSETYCNVFAHDYAWLMGAFVPRVWWKTDDIAHRVAAGEKIEPVYDVTLHEMKANMLSQWFADWGAKFGWATLGDPQDAEARTAAQDAANDGRVVIMVGDTSVQGEDGHITAIIPETGQHKATRHANGEVIYPLQSESGGEPATRTSDSDWFESRFKYPGGLSIWVHA